MQDSPALGAGGAGLPATAREAQAQALARPLPPAARSGAQVRLRRDRRGGAAALERGIGSCQRRRRGPAGSARRRSARSRSARRPGFARPSPAAPCTAGSAARRAGTGRHGGAAALCVGRRLAIAAAAVDGRAWAAPRPPGPPWRAPGGASRAPRRRSAVGSPRRAGDRRDQGGRPGLRMARRAAERPAGLLPRRGKAAACPPPKSLQCTEGGRGAPP